MDINKVQKLNDMAMQLKRHNIYSKDDAISQAERIYGTDNNYVREDTMQNSDELDELRKDVRKLTMAMQHMINDMNDLKQKHVTLEKELNDTRVGMASRQSRHEQTTLTNEEPKKDLNRPIDRNNVAPSEVSVEKFFYFGNK